MGRVGPLDYPELRDVERLIDSADVAEAQRLLGMLGHRPELSVGVTYLATRLLHARGRLDVSGVRDRLRDIVAQTPGFLEAVMLLTRAESGSLGGTASARAPAQVVVATPPQSEVP